MVALLVAAPLIASQCQFQCRCHANSANNNCPVCHFNHQPMDRPPDGQRMATLDVIRECPAPMETPIVAAQAAPHLPSRAPPSA
jgi:hypothetical protein